MKTKNKMIAMVEIAIVLCSVFLVAIPAIAAEQNQEMQKVSASEVTTASEDDYVLGIYGNANEDDTIDMGDVVYVKLAIFGKKPKTELCDAKYDGRINVLDVIQTKLIILGKEKELTFIDSDERIVKVNKPLKRIVVLCRFFFDPLRALKVSKDLIVGVPSTVMKETSGVGYLDEFKDIPSVGWIWHPDAEAILNQNPEVVLILPSSNLDSLQDTLESAGIATVRFYSNVGIASGIERYPEEITKLGYIFNKRDEAEEFRNWYESVLNRIKEKVEKIPEEDKPKVYFESNKPYSISSGYIEKAGGKNIFEGMSGEIDAEAVIERNPDIIVKKVTDMAVMGFPLDADDTAGMVKERKEILNRLELQKVKAVKVGKVYVISGHLTTGGSCSGARNFLQNVYMAKWFHPELFEDLDPKAIHQEYLTRFQGLVIDLDEKGVFVYPEPS